MNIMRSALIATHLVVTGALVSMGLPQVWRSAAQLDSGYTPYAYWMFVALVLLAFVLAAMILRGLVLWRRGRRRPLVAVDFAVLLASWSVFLIFVFANDLPIAAVLLAPVALVLAALTPLGPASLATLPAERGRRVAQGARTAE